MHDILDMGQMLCGMGTCALSTAMRERRCEPLAKAGAMPTGRAYSAHLMGRIGKQSRNGAQDKPRSAPRLHL